MNIESYSSTELAKCNKSPVDMGQWFDVFPANFTYIQIVKSQGSEICYSYRSLMISEMKIPFIISASKSNFYYGRAIVPYDSKVSYRVDQRDFNPNERIRKIEEEYPNRIIDVIKHPKAAMGFSVDAEMELLKAAGYVQSDVIHGELRLTPVIQQLANKLRMQVRTPDNGNSPFDSSYLPATSFETQSQKTNSRILFTKFYPTETGPLAAQMCRSETVSDLEAGLRLHFPTDLDVLRKVQARFVLENLNQDHNQQNRREKEIRGFDKKDELTEKEAPFSWLLRD